MKSSLPAAVITAWLLTSATASGPDPILDRADQERAEEGGHHDRQADGGPELWGAGPGQEAPPEPGVPAQPAPGDPQQPEPGQPGEPGAGVPQQPDPGAPGDGGEQRPKEGPRVTISGSIEYSDYEAGKLRIDVFDGDQRDFSKRPSVVTWHALEAPGSFSVSVPQSVNKVWFSSFNDANENGRPDHEDPTGIYSSNPVDVTAGDVTGVVIELSVRERD